MCYNRFWYAAFELVFTIRSGEKLIRNQYLPLLDVTDAKDALKKARIQWQCKIMCERKKHIFPSSAFSSVNIHASHVVCRDEIDITLSKRTSHGLEKIRVSLFANAGWFLRTRARYNPFAKHGTT